MTAVRILSGFSALVTGVKAYFAVVDPAVEVLCGYRQRAQQLNQGGGGANRVIFLPGDPNGAGGRIEQPRDVGRQELSDENDVRVANIRPLASWARQFSISIWGWDSTAPRDELVQAGATEALFEQTLRALEQVKGAGGPNVEWGGVTWTVAKENTLGSELLVSLLLTHPLMDAPEEIGRPGFELHRTDP